MTAPKIDALMAALDEDRDERPDSWGERADPFTDDTPLVCGVENPEPCESCN